MTVTYSDGKEISRSAPTETITVQPVDQIILVGTYEAPAPGPARTAGCDPNYSGACVPIASDVNCAGGSGDGPAYVNGPV